MAGQAGTVYWPLTDHLGSVREVINSAGTIVNTIRYNAFGQIVPGTNTGTQHLFAFTGRAWDPESGLYYYRARWYDPAVARFLSEDPKGFAAGDTNLTRYTFNNPTHLTDPSGMDVFDWIARTIGVKNVLSWDRVLGDYRTGWFAQTSNFFAGTADSLTFGLTRHARGAMGYDDVVDRSSSAYAWGDVTGEVINPLNYVGFGLAMRGARAIGVAARVSSWSFRGAKIARPAAKFALGFAAGAAADSATQGLRLLGGQQEQFSVGRAMAAGAVSGAFMQFAKMCFTADMELLTHRGWVRMDELRVGGLVACCNENDPYGPIEWKPVEELFTNVDRIWQVAVRGEHSDESRLIRTTHEHPIFVYDKGWTATKELQPGDRFRSNDGQVVTVEEVYDTGIEERVYNCRVADHHTYFVGKGEWGFGVWAHNASQVVPRRGMRQTVVTANNGRRATIHGTAQLDKVNGQVTEESAMHAWRIGRKAIELARSGKYSDVVLNRSWGTATGRLSKSRFRPDITARRWGKADIHDAWEFASAGQRGQEALLRQRLACVCRKKRRFSQVTPIWRPVTLP